MSRDGTEEERTARGLGRTVMGLGAVAAVAAAYGVYLWGRPGARRRPVTELRAALPLRLHYVAWNNCYYSYYSRAGSGRPVVLVHAINAVASAHEMKPLVRRLQRGTDRPIFALEWLGFGHSDRPDVDYTPDLLENQLEHFLTRIVRASGGADVIGLSLGATYTAALARRRPDLVHSLVAIEPAGLGDEPQAMGRAWSRLLFTLSGVQRAFYDRLTAPEALYRFARDHIFSPDFDVPDEYIEYGAETARMEGAARPFDDFLDGQLFPADAEDAFFHMRQPLLIAHGLLASRRMESYTDLPRLAERPNVEVVGLPTGALPHWERPGEVMEIIETFYSRVSTTTPASA